MKNTILPLRILMILVVAGLSLQCQEKGTFNPVGPPTRTLRIDRPTANPNRIAAGGGESIVSGWIIDQDDEPYIGKRVTFQARRGTIDAVDTTDQAGAFSARYVSGDAPGTDTVTVSVENETASVYITLTGSSADITLQLAKLSILANGFDTTLVTAILIGRSGPLNRIPVRFETTAGTFTGQRTTFGQTDIDGRATVVITSSSSTTTITATITATIEDVSTIAPIKSFQPRIRRGVSGLSHRVEPASVDAEASIPITYRGVDISVEATPDLIPGDGQSTSEIRAFIKEENNQAVPNAQVTFSARLGSIPVQAFTDGAGVVRVNLTSATLPGATDRVVARYGPLLADSVEVIYAATVGRIVLSSDVQSFLANGKNNATITAQVFGGTGRVAPNVEVSFTTDTGFVFPQRVVTDIDGKAVTRLTSPGSSDNLMVTVRGEVVQSAGSEDLSLPNQLFSELRRSVLTLSQGSANLAVGPFASRSEPATPRRSIAPGHGQPQLTPGVDVLLRGVDTPQQRNTQPPSLQGVDTPQQPISKDTLRSPESLAVESQVSILARGVQLSLSVNPDSLVARTGSLSALSAHVFETTSGNPVIGDTVRFGTTFGSVPGSAILDDEGIAHANFTAGDQVGTAVVTARYGSVFRTDATIELLPLIGRLMLRADRLSIRSGGIDSSSITAQLFDPLGNSVPNIEITFSSDHLPGEFVSKVTNADGLASYVIVSPAFELDSAFRVIAVAGAISEEIRIRVRAISRSIGADPDSLSSGSSQPVTITFEAFESATHRPILGDTVWFSATGGVVQPFAILNAEGVARTTFRVGSEPGTALAIGQLGGLKPDTARMVLVEPVHSVVTRVARRSILANGVDTTIVTAIVSNILGQPAPRVWVSFRTNSGTLTPAVALTDSTGLARVQFQSSADNNDSHSEIIVSAIEGIVALAPQPRDIVPQLSRPSPSRALNGIPAWLQNPQPKLSQDAFTLKTVPLSGDAPSHSGESIIPSIPALPRIYDVHDTVTVETRGVTLTLRASINSIRADGRSRAGINIQLTETTTGSAIATARLRIGATRGAIIAEGVTRNDGTFTDSLTVGVVPGNCVVRVTYGNLILASDTLEFTPDPARQNLNFQLDTLQATAGSDERIHLSGRVVDEDGAPSNGIGVKFTLEGALWALVDPSENIQVTRYENTFRVDDREAITSLRLLAQLRGVESVQTQILLNRTLLDQVALPQADLWGDYTLSLPTDRLLDGVNRLEIIGGDVGGVVDRFSIAGVRLGLMGSHVLSEAFTGEDGTVEAEWPVGPVAGVVTFKAALTEAPARFIQRNLRLTPGNPVAIRLSTAADTLLANGAEESSLLALVTDANGNPATSGVRIAFATEDGQIRPQEAQTLGDGTASAIYTSSASDRDVQAVLTASGGGADGLWRLLLRGARLRLTVPDARLLADGNSQMEIRARLSTADGAAVAGRRIDFVTTRGSITPSAQTGNDGVALAILTAADVADTARITAAFGPVISDSGLVIFASLIDHIEITSSPESIRADGLDSTSVTVTATDGLGRGASGVRIDLNIDRGRISSRRVLTDGSGSATVKVFGTALSEDDSLRVVASTSSGNHRDTLYVRLRGVTFTLLSDRDSLAANGVATASVTARIVETSNGNAVTSGRVAFSTDLGGISATANLDQSGQAVATYTASATIGLATVRAVYGNTLNASDTIRLVDKVAALELTVSPQLILANGSQRALLIARVTDSWGEGASHEQVSFNFEGAGTVSPNVGITNDDGEFRATARGFGSSNNGRLLVTASIRGGRFTETVAIDLRGVTLDLEASPVLIAGDGRSVSTLTARLRETYTGHPITNDTIRFMTSAGIITPFRLTDQNGEASVSLRSDAHPAIATVVAEYGNRLADTAQVAFAGRYSYLDLSLERQSLLADGVDSGLATVLLVDTLRRPVEGVAVFFTLIDTLGTLSNDSAVTDNNGLTSISWRSTASQTDLSARIRASAGALADTARLSMRGVTITLSANQDTIPANGVAESRITAQVRETVRGNPVTGRSVSFRTDAGVIPALSNLDENGQTTVALRAAVQPGTATVTADFGRSLSAQRRVAFIPTVGSLSFSAGRARILADGTDTTLIRLRLVDGANNPAPNVRITLGTPGGGQIIPSNVVTDEDGSAEAIYRSFAFSSDSIVQITGVATGGAAAQISVRIVGLTLLLEANPDHLSANGRAESQISATLFESIRHTPLSSRRIAYSSNRGRIIESNETDADGIAVVTFTAPNVAGDVLISADYGDTLTATLTVSCQASVPRTAELTIDPITVSVAGVGRDESAVLTALIRDATGQIVADNNLIVLKIAPSRGTRFQNDLDTIVVRTSEGIVTANVHSGDTPGTVRFQVWFEGRLLASGGELTVRSGPAARLRVRPDISTIHIPAGGFTAFPVSATVSDRFGNPVEDGTIVRFSLSPDTLASITGEGRTAGGVVSTPVAPIDYPTGIWLTYSNDVAGEVVWIHAVSGENVHDSSRVILPGALQGGEPERMEAGFDSLSLVADGQSTAQLTINLIDADGRPVADMTQVRLSSTLGIVQTPRFTAGGTATATYRAGRVSGIDTVRIESGNISDQITLRLRSGTPDHLEVVADRDHLRADSTDNTTITATVYDRFDNLVLPGTPVLFFTTLGSIDIFSETNEEGVASALLTAGTRTGTAIVRATAGEVDAITTVVFESGDPSNVVFIGANRQSIGVKGAGQPETANLIFEVRDDRGVAVDSLHSTFVRFLLDGPVKVIDPDSSSTDSIATLSPDSVLTDAHGQVSVTLHSGYFAGAVEVSGRVGERIGGRAIAIAIRGGPPDESHFTIQPNRCVTTGIEGTPTDTTLISVTLGDRFSNPVTPGTVLRFRSSGGVIEGSAVTDTLGIATVLLRTTRPWPENGIDTIEAQTIDFQDREIRAVTTMLVTGPTIATFDTADGWEIPFGSYHDFVLTVADLYGHSLSAGTEILITATAFDVRGNALQGIVLAGPGTVEPIVLSECDLQTEFSVRLFNYISGLEASDLSVVATVTSPNGNRQVVTQGLGAAQVFSTEFSRIILSPTEIVADGADACLMRITLYDTLGIAIQNVPPDNIQITAVGGDVIVTPPAAITDQFGRVNAALVGRAVGEARIETRVNGQLIDEQPILTLVAGPPTVMSAQVLNRRLEVGGDTTTVAVEISDAFGNPTADGTVVTFDIDDGNFDPASTTTRDGRASTVLSSGYTAGIVQITVRASRRGAAVVGFIPNIRYTPGPPDQISVTAPTFSVVVGSESIITISAVDQFGNAVNGGELIDLIAQPNDNGEDITASVNTDTMGVATATFTAGTVAGAHSRIIATSDSGRVSGQSSQFTYNPGPPGALSLVAEPASQQVGNDVNITATVLDTYGNPVSDTTRVAFTRNPALGILSPSAIRTSGGVARSVLSGVDQAGNIEVNATSADVSASVLVRFTP